MGWRNRAISSLREAQERLRRVEVELVSSTEKYDTWEIASNALGAQQSVNDLLAGLLEDTGLFEKKERDEKGGGERRRARSAGKGNCICPLHGAAGCSKPAKPGYVCVVCVDSGCKWQAKMWEEG